MDNDELKRALFSRRPVVAEDPLRGETEYKYVSRVTYCVGPENKLIIGAECIDKSGHSVSIVDAKYLKFKE